MNLERRRVLLVDDGVANRNLFSIILTKAGAEVTQAGNGRDGVNAVKDSLNNDRPFDIILMDMQMPVMDGLTATQILREMGVKTPIVALTANTEQDEHDQCHAAGFSGFLTKPIHRDTLLSAIANHL